MNMNGFHGISKEDSVHAWPYAKEYIQKALVRTHADRDYDIEDIRKRVAEGTYQLWLYIDDGVKCAVITQILKYPKCKHLDICFVGSEEQTMIKWFDMAIRKLLIYAREQNCSVFRGDGRAGWFKMLSKHGTVRRETTSILRLENA